VITVAFDLNDDGKNDFLILIFITSLINFQVSFKSLFAPSNLLS
jgi:hypothetical protein